MSGAKHTPGPWERLEGVALRGHPEYAEGQCVTRIVQKREPGQTEFVKVALVDAGPVNANARLIASAPDLLEALQLVRRFNTCGPGTDALIDRAIAKATGADQ